MLVGTLQVEFLLTDAFSLKEKRFVLQSLKSKIQNRFNVSVAEIDFQDKWQRSTIGVACVSSDKKTIESTLDRVLELFFAEDRIEVLDQLKEIF
jgi:uncharacterized protein YlxP (DUF503 family)